MSIPDYIKADREAAERERAQTKVLATFKAGAQDIIDLALNAGLISPGQAAKLGGLVASATWMSMSWTMKQIIKAMGAPDLDPQPRQEPDTSTNSDISA